MVSGAACSYAALAVALSFLTLALFAAVVAMWERWRLGATLLNECSGDTATAWAELRELHERSLADEKRLREAMASYYGTTAGGDSERV